jgi:hypothetical protein
MAMSPLLLQPGPPSSSAAKRRLRLVVGSLAILLLTLAAYYPAIARGGFIWDDGLLIFQHDAILSQNPLAAFNDRESVDFFPLTTLSFWTEFSFYGERPLGYHLDNVLLHAAGAILLWQVLRRLKVPGAFPAALLYALHPVAVESVAWIAERKNTLSQLLFFAAMNRFLAFEDAANDARPIRLGAWRSYAAALVLFLLGLLAKTSIVMLPPMLLLLAWYRRSRITLTDLLRTAPFFLLSLLLGLVTLYKQHLATDMIAQLHATLPAFPVRAISAGWAFWFYLGKALWPTRLMMVYPAFPLSHRWLDALPLIAIPIAFLLAGVLVVQTRRRWPRALLVGLGMFLLALLPTLGFIKITYLAFAPAADHLQYLALPAIIALVVGSCAALLRRACTRPARRIAATALTLLAAAACFVCTFRQSDIYHNERTLWEANLAADERAWVPHAFLARYLQANTDPSPEQDREILHHLRRAVELAPDNPIPHQELAEICRYLDYPLESRAHFAIAVDLLPDISKDHNPLRGPITSTPDDTARALADLRSALARHPGFHFTRITLDLLETPASQPQTRGH